MQKVTVLQPNPSKIPELLRNKSSWICWKKSDLKPNGRYGKLPTNTHGVVINAHDISHHVDLETAHRSYLSSNHQLAGIAIDLPVNPIASSTTDDGEPLYLIGGDIDECVTITNGKPIINNKAKSDLKALGNPYWEISPSGTGIRWFGLHTRPLKGGNKNGREMYSRGRFLTVTGQSKGGDISTLPSDIELLEQEWFGSIKPTDINQDLLAHLSSAPYQMPQIINDGEGRNAGLLSHAGHLRAKGLCQEEIELGCIGFNQQKINPPLPLEKVLDISRRYAEEKITPNNPEPIGLTHSTKKEFELNLNSGFIKLVATSPKRPFIAGNDIIPMGTYSALGGFGGVGKTIAAVSLGTQASIGGSFAGRSCEETCVLMLACEDSDAEINARFCAAIESLPEEKQEQALRNIRVFSLVGQDVHMVKMVNRNAEPTGKSSVLINAINELKAKTGLDRCLVVIDHARMIASVDWNDSAQATVFTREMQHIASETGAGVVVLTHTNKAALNSKIESNQGDISGSTSIVDNARWVAIVHGMTDDEAKFLEIEKNAKQNYVSLVIVKANYCATGRIGWFLKRTAAHHSTSVLDYVELAKPSLSKPGDNTLEKRLIEYLKTHPGLTINKVKGFAGIKGVFKASEKKVTSTIQDLIDKEVIKLAAPSNERRKELGLPKNTAGILVVSEGI